MGQIRPSLGKGSNATIPRHMGFSTPICRRAVSDPFCIFFPMMIFWKIKVNYVYLANFKLESGLRIRVTILDCRWRQRVKGMMNQNFQYFFFIPNERSCQIKNILLKAKIFISNGLHGKNYWIPQFVNQMKTSVWLTNWGNFYITKFGFLGAAWRPFKIKFFSQLHVMLPART